MTAESLFVPAAKGAWLPTDDARGPWTPEALHGGPTAALLARAIEPLLDPLLPVRLTIELLRPVPVAPLVVDAELIRPGKKVRLAGARLLHDGTIVATATALAIRTEAVAVPEQPTPPMPPLPAEGTTLVPNALGYDAFHSHGVEHRFVTGSFTEAGPATDWIRLRVPVVPNELPSGLQRVAAAADFGNGISRVSSLEALTFINPDLTIYLERAPVGEWICLDAVSRLHAHGIGLAESALYDETGRLGRSVQSLLVS
ncbi:MAG: hypothetical protein QOE63_305 [Acidimicrobiaceae bacterium]